MSAGRLAAMLIAAIVSVPVLMTLASSLAAARNEIIAPCHEVLVFPRENCRMYNGGWMCSGSGVATQWCYHPKGDPR